MYSNTDILDAVTNKAFSTLTHLQPVLDEQYGEPWYSTGKFGIVFKMQDADGKLYALKCFKEKDPEKERRLRLIAETIQSYPSPYWISYDFYEEELRIDEGYGQTSYGSVLLMEWIEGQTLGQYVQQCCERYDQVALYRLAYAFDQMAIWLLNSPFAHGDLKHDNIIIKPNGLPVLVDYDGMFIPELAGHQALELGTPEYQHPKRQAQHYGAYLDDFSILIISLSLYGLAHEPSWHRQYSTGENILLTELDFIDFQQSKVLKMIRAIDEFELHQRSDMLSYIFRDFPQSFSDLSKSLKPTKNYILRVRNLQLHKEVKKIQTPTIIKRVSSSIQKKLPDLIPYRKGRKWGFCDQSRKALIPCLYEDVKMFTMNLAAVKRGDKWGYIDKTGKEAIPFAYEGCSNFSEGLATVKRGNKWGIINEDGRIIFDFVFDYDYESGLNFSDGLAVLIKGKVGLGYINQCGYVDKFGKEVIRCIYWYCGQFSEGLATVEKEGLRGFINKSGTVVIPFIYNSSLDFSEGLAAVANNINWGFINRAGKVVIPFDYMHCLSFSEGLAVVVKNNNWNFIDRNGKQLSSVVYEKCESFSESLAAVKKDRKWGFVDKTGREAIPCIYDTGSEEPFVFNFKFGVDYFAEYKHDYKFSEGLAAVKKNDMWGYINKEGDTVIPFIYSNLLSPNFKQGLAYVIRNNAKFYIDYEGIEYWE